MNFEIEGKKSLVEADKQDQGGNIFGLVQLKIFELDCDKTFTLFYHPS